ncbi:MAG: hypothetical protein DRQ61_04545 [Gammaproteobacteria bacterium]|nr:MAG: hypothetical protein DRQ61_04545 [Gammaproteobacteria bacterium]
MAIKATIFKAELQISDMDRNYYASHSLTLARHPSETDERMLIRLLAFILNASESLQFTKGLSEDEEPELWEKNLTDEIDLWIEVGMPDERRIRKACSRSKAVILYSYGGRNDVWWQQIQNKLTRFKNLKVVNFSKQSTEPLTNLVERTMQFDCSIQDGQIWITHEGDSFSVEPEVWFGSV